MTLAMGSRLRRLDEMRRLAVALLAVLAMGASSPPDVVPAFFKALDKHDAAAVAALLHPEASLWRLGEDRPVAFGPDAVREFFLSRFRDFPKWRTKGVNPIAAGAFVAVRERATPEPGERSRETLFLFEVREGVIRRAWSLEGQSEGGGEGAAALLVEKWNDRDLPRFLALFDDGASLWELPSGQRLAAGEDALRARLEGAFEEAAHRRVEVTGHLSLPPWVVYRSRGLMDSEQREGESLTIFEARDNLVRRVWYVRGGP